MAAETADIAGIDVRETAKLRHRAEALDRLVLAWLDGLETPAGRNGKRLLFVTLATADYAEGVRVLARSLRQHSALPLLVLATDDMAVADDPATRLMRVPEIVKADIVASAAPHFRRTLTKLWAFGLVSVDRIVFLDADCVVRAPIDHLFDGQDFAAAPDLLSNRPAPTFNSGVFALSPSVEQRDALFAFLPTAPSFDGGDQGLLNAFIGGKLRWLPVADNFLRSYVLAGEADWRQARVLHFTAKKPWRIEGTMAGDAALLALDDDWTARLKPDELMTLVARWRRNVAAAEESRDTSYRLLKAEIEAMRGRMRRIATLLIVLSGLVALDILARIILP